MKKETKLIRQARKRAGLTQRQISDYLGFKQGQLISNAERGKCGIPKDKRREFCKITKLEPTEYFNALVKDFKKEIYEDLF